MANSRFKINLCFAHRRRVICHECFMEVSPGKLYINISINSSNYGNPDFMIPLCKNCWDNMNNKVIFEYDNKKNNYGEYLKKKIVKNL